MSEEHKTVIAPATVLAPPDSAKVGDKNVAPTTTAAEDLTTEGQREINRMWERTQRVIALGVIFSSLGVAILLGVAGKKLGTVDMQLAALVFLFGVANLVTGFYFGRTNHQRSSGDSGGVKGYVGR